VRDRMAATPADFILHTGDMIYDSGAAADFNPKFFTPYANLVRRLVFWPCPGNHDWETASGQPWRDAFYTPANNPAHSENYYSFDYGNAHVVVINSNDSTSPGSAQYNFLDADLAASSATWKFVAFHHTIYSNSSHGSNTGIRNNLVPLFDRRGVDIVLMGHDHDYERTKPLRANQIVAPGAGTVYVTTGGGGRDLYGAGQSSFTAYSESTHHFTRVAINGSTLALDMIRTDGVVRDSLTLVKGATTTTVAVTTTTHASTTTTTHAPTTTTTPVSTTTTTHVSTTTTTHVSTTTTTPVSTTTTTTHHVTTTTHATTTSMASSTSTSVAVTTTTSASTTTTTLALPDGFALSPVADTYIEGRGEVSWDHGAADHLDVDASPAGVTYLKFDLSAVTGSITGAVLRLHATNPASDGGTIYRVLDSSWIEGTGTATDGTSADGPGLKWMDVDTNHDGVLDESDSSPFAPNPSQMVTSIGPVARGNSYDIDVTAAFDGGPTVYTLAIMSTSSDGATYASREHVNEETHPVLLVSVAPTTSPACGNGVRESDEQCDGEDDDACPGACQTDCTCPSYKCLADAGPLTRLTGAYNRRYRNLNLAPDSKLDARSATFIAGPSNRYPVTLRGDAHICFAGGTVAGQYDRNAGWQKMHELNNAGIAFRNADLTIDGLRIDNVTDGIRPEGHGNFTVQGVWLSYIRDDCIENDHLLGGLVDDSLFDGCYVAFSARPSGRIVGDGRDNVWTIQNSLVRLAPMPGPRKGAASDLGNGSFFKWHLWKDSVHSRSPKIALHNNIFLAEKVSQDGADRMGLPPDKVESCSDNVMVWLGGGDYPAQLPDCFTVTTDRSVWDDAVAAWKLRHPSR
jgi:hypothetical protein